MDCLIDTSTQPVGVCAGNARTQLILIIQSLFIKKKKKTCWASGPSHDTTAFVYCALVTV